MNFYKFLQNLSFFQIIIFAVTLRLLFFILLIIFPYNHNLFGFIGPTQYQYIISDNLFYIDFSDGRIFNLENFKNNYLNLIKFNFNEINNRYPGFIYPLILNVTFYSKDFALLLNSICFLLEIISMSIIVKYLVVNYSNFCAFIYTILPIPIISSFFPSSDLIFFVIFIIFYFYFLNLKTTKIFNKDILYFTLIFLLVFTRPIGLLIALYGIFIYKKNKFNYFLSSLIILLGILYYLPYLILELRNLNNISIQNQYDKNIVYIILDFLKDVLYLFGMNPSSSGNSTFQLVKVISGIYLMIGYLNIFFKAKIKTIILVNLIIIPTLLFFSPAWRYILPIYPILHIYSFLFFKKFIVK